MLYILFYGVYEVDVGEIADVLAGVLTKSVNFPSYLRDKVNPVRYDGALTARGGMKCISRGVEPANNRECCYITGLRCIMTCHAK